MKNVSSLVSRRLGYAPLQDDLAESRTIKWTPVIEKNPNCRPKLRTALWGEIDGRLIVTVEETSDGWKWYFSSDRDPGSEESFGYAPTRDRAREIADSKWAQKLKPKAKWRAAKKTDALYKNVLISLALQCVFYLGSILLTIVALAYVTLPLQTQALQTFQNLARLFGGNR
jgi:hypothetical protein